MLTFGRVHSSKNQYFLNDVCMTLQTTNYIHSKNVTQNRFPCNITAEFTDGVSNSLMQLTSKKLSIIFNFWHHLKEDYLQLYEETIKILLSFDTNLFALVFDT